MAEKTYKVAREHEGDRFYRRGDTRSLSASDAANLVRLGVLVEEAADDDDDDKAGSKDSAPQGKGKGKGKSPEAKALDPSAQIGALTVDNISLKGDVARAKAEAPAVENKAEGAAPENKAVASPDDAADGAATGAGG